MLWRGVYAVGRPTVTPRGRWRAATLVCGAGAALDGESGLALWDVRSNEGKAIEVAVPESARRDQTGIKLRRVRGLADQVTAIDGIPVLSLPPLFVLLAGRVKPGALEAAINEADKKDLIHVEQLRREIEALRGRRGVAALRRVIDRATFRYTDSELERAMRPVFRAAKLRAPETQQRVNGCLVDFYWPELNFVIETDGGRFHRTAFQQASDRRRDQAHTLANTAFLRFTHGQIRYERAYVKWAVAKKARDLRRIGWSLTGVPTPVALQPIAQAAPVTAAWISLICASISGRRWSICSSCSSSVSSAFTSLSTAVVSESVPSTVPRVPLTSPRVPSTRPSWPSTSSSTPSTRFIRRGRVGRDQGHRQAAAGTGGSTRWSSNASAGVTVAWRTGGVPRKTGSTIGTVRGEISPSSASLSAVLAWAIRNATFITGTTSASATRDWRRPARLRCQRGMVAIVAVRRTRLTMRAPGRSTRGSSGKITDAVSRWSIIAWVASEAASRGRTDSKYSRMPSRVRGTLSGSQV